MSLHTWWKRNSHHARAFLRGQLWDTDLRRIPPLQAHAIRALRVAVVLVKQLLEGRLLLRASAMTFTMLLTMVPLMVVAFSAFQAFGGFADLQGRLERFILDNIAPGSQEQVRDWLYKFFESVRSGAFSGVTVVFLLGGVLGLISSLEGALNEVWGVRRTRSLIQRVSIYLTLVMLGPILVGVSLSMTASLESATFWGWLGRVAPGSALLIGIAFKVAPVLLTGLALTILYTILPNAKVRLRASLLGGLVAGFLFELLKGGYAIYLRRATQYSALYGSLAAIPIFIFWVHLTWIVVLFGAELTFARDGAEDIRDEELALRATTRERLRVAFQLSLEAARSYRLGEVPPGPVALSHRMGLPLRLVTRVAEILTEGCILHRVAGGPSDGGLVPARSPERITVHDVMCAVLDRGEPVAHRASHEPTHLAVEALMEEYDATLREAWGTPSLSDLLDRGHLLSEPSVLPFPSRRRDESS